MMQIKKILIHNPRFNFGKRETKEIKKKYNGIKVSLTAVKNKREEENIVGYTKLKEYKEKPENTSQSGNENTKEEVILRVHNINDTRGYTECKAYEKKKLLHKIVGYLPVGIKGDEFVAVVKLRILPIIILLGLLLGMLFGFAMCDANNDPESPWKPIIQDFTDQWVEEETTREAGSIDVQGFTAISADKDTGVAKVCLRNPEGNPCYFTFYIYTDNGILLYESDEVPPDNEITKITLNTTFEGKQKGYVFVETHELETGNEMNSAKFDIDIIFN